MDHDVASEGSGTGKRLSKAQGGTANGGKSLRTKQKNQVKISPFHVSPISNNGQILLNKQTGTAPLRTYGTPRSFSFGPFRRNLTTSSLGREPVSAAATNSEGQTPCSSSTQPTLEGRAKAAGKLTSTSTASKKGVKSNKTDSEKSGTASQKKLPLSQKSKAKLDAPAKPQTAIKRKKRKMGLYSFVPKKKTRVLKQLEKKEDSVAYTEENKTEVDLVEDSKSCEILPETLSVGEVTSFRKEARADRSVEECSRVEYTELALETLDLKAQEELLSPSLSGVPVDAEVTETDLAEELPLCCCRMETPSSGSSFSSAEQTCMATESIDGMVSRCQRRVMKQELMRPSNTVHLLVLCEDHRAGMVKHQCCPGCGLFCRAGTFLECRPYGSISHRFHRGCASILKEHRFCPHCGEDASGATEVTVPKPDPVASVPKPDPGPALPAVRTPPTAPVAPLVLRAKKTSKPERMHGRSPDRLKGDPLRAGERPLKESLESILMALDDENFKRKKVMYPTKQLYISAKQGELQKVIHLLVDGKDPNFIMETQNKRTPLHAAAAGGYHEICHMLVQAGANLDMFDDMQRTPLMDACEGNHLDTVKYLLRAGAAVGHKDVSGSTCLHLATKLGHCDILHHLLSKSSKYTNCQDGGGWTPITWAIENKHREVVQLLLARGADVNIRDKEENVCLHWSALSGCDDLAQALLDARCDLQATNVHGDTPLHIAARENHLECVTLFLSRGADVNLRNKEGDTALDCCTHGSKVWAALNTNKKLTDVRRGRDCQWERVLSRDISRGYEAVPITCVNGVDSEPCPQNFKYIPDNCVTSPLSIDKDFSHLQHCTCTDECSASTCLCGQLSLRCWYDSEGRLPLDFCQREPPVLFECNHACACWRTCRNRVVQNGLRVRLQLFRTQKMGWGIRAMQNIPQGTFICEYVGEIITDAEADKRENDSFLFSLDNTVGDEHCIDARLFGNVGRFLNHLCEPNLTAVRVFTMHQDLRFPRIAFFSSRPVQAGEQIGFDYGDNFWRIKSKYFSCHCGSPACRHSPAAGVQSTESPATAAKRDA